MYKKSRDIFRMRITKKMSTHARVESKELFGCTGLYSGVEM